MGIMLQENGRLKTLLVDLCPEMSQTRRDRWCYALAVAAADTNFPLDKQGLMDFLVEPGHAPSVARRPETWLDWAERKTRARMREEQEARASPPPPDTSEPELFKQARALQEAEESTDANLAE